MFGLSLSFCIARMFRLLPQDLSQCFCLLPPERPRVHEKHRLSQTQSVPLASLLVGLEVTATIKKHKKPPGRRG